MAKKTKKKSKKPTSNRKARSVMGSSFLKIERIWAEHGIVRIQMKTGETKNLSISDAKQRRKIISMARPPSWHMSKYQDFLEEAAKAIKEAEYQVERKDDDKTIALHNMFEGRAPDGRPINEIVKEASRVQSYLMRFHTLEEREIGVIIRSEYPTHMQELLMANEHAARMLAMSKDDSAPALLGANGKPIG